MKIAHLRFDDDLRALLKRRKTTDDLECRFEGPQSLKHIIESLGIPHTEFGVMRANGVAVAPGYLVRHGDLIEAASIAPVGDLGAEPRFAIDGHLGRLAAKLRMFGLDCLYRNDYDDTELAHTAVEEHRILLSRDRRLLMRKTILDGCLVRSLDPRQQLRQVIQRFGLTKWIRPFQRCIRCNHLLQPVEKQDILGRLEPLTRRYFSEFHICPACSQIYWKGSHFDRMQQIISSMS
jgi:hypothetical protein